MVTPRSESEGPVGGVGEVVPRAPSDDVAGVEHTDRPVGRCARGSARHRVRGRRAGGRRGFERAERVADRRGRSVGGAHPREPGEQCTATLRDLGHGSETTRLDFVGDATPALPHETAVARRLLGEHAVRVDHRLDQRGESGSRLITPRADTESAAAHEQSEVRVDRLVPVVETAHHARQPVGMRPQRGVDAGVVGDRGDTGDRGRPLSGVHRVPGVGGVRPAAHRVVGGEVEHDRHRSIEVLALARATVLANQFLDPLQAVELAGRPVVERRPVPVDVTAPELHGDRGRHTDGAGEQVIGVVEVHQPVGGQTALCSRGTGTGRRRHDRQSEQERCGDERPDETHTIVLRHGRLST